MSNGERPSDRALRNDSLFPQRRHDGKQPSQRGYAGIQTRPDGISRSTERRRPHVKLRGLPTRPLIFQQTSQNPVFEEQSNVDMGEEMVNLIQAQREFELNVKVVGTTDAMLGSLLSIRK